MQHWALPNRQKAMRHFSDPMHVLWIKYCEPQGKARITIDSTLTNLLNQLPYQKIPKDTIYNQGETDNATHLIDLFDILVPISASQGLFVSYLLQNKSILALPLKQISKIVNYSMRIIIQYAQQFVLLDPSSFFTGTEDKLISTLGSSIIQLSFLLAEPTLSDSIAVTNPFFKYLTTADIIQRSASMDKRVFSFLFDVFSSTTQRLSASADFLSCLVEFCSQFFLSVSSQFGTVYLNLSQLQSISTFLKLAQKISSDPILLRIQSGAVNILNQIPLAMQNGIDVQGVYSVGICAMTAASIQIQGGVDPMKQFVLFALWCFDQFGFEKAGQPHINVRMGLILLENLVQISRFDSFVISVSDMLRDLIRTDFPPSDGYNHEAKELIQYLFAILFSCLECAKCVSFIGNNGVWNLLFHPFIINGESPMALDELFHLINSMCFAGDELCKMFLLKLCQCLISSSDLMCNKIMRFLSELAAMNPLMFEQNFPSLMISNWLMSYCDKSDSKELYDFLNSLFSLRKNATTFSGDGQFVRFTLAYRHNSKPFLSVFTKFIAFSQNAESIRFLLRILTEEVKSILEDKLFDHLASIYAEIRPAISAWKPFYEGCFKEFFDLSVSILETVPSKELVKPLLYVIFILTKQSHSLRFPHYRDLMNCFRACEHTDELLKLFLFCAFGDAENKCLLDAEALSFIHLNSLSSDMHFELMKEVLKRLSASKALLLEAAQSSFPTVLIEYLRSANSSGSYSVCFSIINEILSVSWKGVDFTQISDVCDSEQYRDFFRRQVECMSKFNSSLMISNVYVPVQAPKIELQSFTVSFRAFCEDFPINLLTLSNTYGFSLKVISEKSRFIVLVSNLYRMEVPIPPRKSEWNTISLSASDGLFSFCAGKRGFTQKCPMQLPYSSLSLSFGADTKQPTFWISSIFVSSKPIALSTLLGPSELEYNEFEESEFVSRPCNSVSITNFLTNSDGFRRVIKFFKYDILGFELLCERISKEGVGAEEFFSILPSVFEECKIISEKIAETLVNLFKICSPKGITFWFNIPMWAELVSTSEKVISSLFNDLLPSLLPLCHIEVQSLLDLFSVPSSDEFKESVWNLIFSLLHFSPSICRSQELIDYVNLRRPISFFLRFFGLRNISLKTSELFEVLEKKVICNFLFIFINNATKDQITLDAFLNLEHFFFSTSQHSTFFDVLLGIFPLFEESSLLNDLTDAFGKNHKLRSVILSDEVNILFISSFIIHESSDAPRYQKALDFITSVLAYSISEKSKFHLLFFTFFSLFGHKRLNASIFHALLGRNKCQAEVVAFAIHFILFDPSITIDGVGPNEILTELRSKCRDISFCFHEQLSRTETDKIDLARFLVEWANPDIGLTSVGNSFTLMNSSFLKVDSDSAQAAVNAFKITYSSQKIDPEYIVCFLNQLSLIALGDSKCFAALTDLCYHFRDILCEDIEWMIGDGTFSRNKAKCLSDTFSILFQAKNRKITEDFSNIAELLTKNSRRVISDLINSIS